MRAALADNSVQPGAGELGAVLGRKSGLGRHSPPTHSTHCRNRVNLASERERVALSLLESRSASQRRRQVVIAGVQLSETLQLLSVLIVLAFVLVSIYLVQKYTGV